MRLLSLALRNLLRNRRRSLTTLTAMVLGVVTVLLFGGYTRNITYSLQTGYVERSGHLQVQRNGYFLYGTGNPAAYGIADYRRVMQTIARDPVLAPMTTVLTPTLAFGGIAGNFSAAVSRTVLGTGIVVEDQNRLRQWNDYGLPFSRQPLALTGSAPDAAVLGTGVARVLQLCAALHVPDCAGQRPPAERPAQGPAAPADILSLAQGEQVSEPSQDEARIELLAANVHGVPNVASLRVVKAENQGFKEFDDIYVAMHLPEAQRLVYGSGEPQVTALIVQLAHTAQMPAARSRLEHLLATQLKDQDLEVLDYETLNPFYGQAVGMFDAIFGFIAVLIGSIVLFTVANTMSMAVVERTAEIGTLRAMGVRRAGIRRLFVSEGLILGALSAVAGIALSLGLAWLVNHSGLTWLPPGQVNRLPLTVRLAGESRMMIGTAAGLLAVALLSAWLPARRAARMNVVDALRHV